MLVYQGCIIKHQTEWLGDLVYRVIIHQPTGGTISTEEFVHPGDTVTLDNTPDTGWQFDHYTVDGEPIEGNTFTMPEHDVEISGEFTQITYTITVNSGSHGTITAPTTAHYGDTVNITATTDYGWLVDHYTVNGSTISGSSFTMPAANVTIGVTYKEDPNPLGLGPYTIRFQFENESYDPRNDHGDQPYPSTARWTKRSTSPNTWDFRYLNTNWSGMFSGDAFGDYARTGWIHVLGANLGSVTNMYQMLNNAGPIKTIAYFDTSKATNLQGAFRGLPNLQAIPKFNTSSATNMSYMIENDSSLTAIPLFNTSRATNVSYMCRSVGNCSGAYALYNQMATQATPPANHAYCFTGCGSTADRRKIPQSWGGDAAG
jgi:surface protein